MFARFVAVMLRCIEDHDETNPTLKISIQMIIPLKTDTKGRTGSERSKLIALLKLSRILMKRVDD